MIDIKKIRTKLGLIQKKYIFLLTAIVILVLAVIAIFIGRQTNKQLSNTASVSASVKSPFGTMIAFNINNAAISAPDTPDILQQKGWTEFRKDDPAYQNLLSNLKKIIQDRTKLVEETGFSIDRGSFGYFTWNVIEPQKGQFDWELTDLYVKGASDAGVKISAVVQPFAGWDQKNTQINKGSLDFAYYDYKAGPPNDLTEYQNFLTKTVERYKNNVAVWEIANEPDSPDGGYKDNPEAYFNLLKISSETIKKVDPLAKVANGGASGHSNNSEEISFWTKFFELSGGQYIDYFNLHYNDDRSQDAKLDPAIFQRDLIFFNNLMDKNGGRKPLYLTEFGIYSGSPSSQLPGQPAQGSAQAQANAAIKPPAGGKCGDGICDAFEKQNPNACPQDCGTSIQQPQSETSASNQNLPNLSADSQAVLYFKDTILAFANGVHTVFIDLIGPDGGMVGSSMAFNTDNQPRLFLTTLKAIESKIGGFSKVEKIADGQYKLTVGNKVVYALWSGTLPKEISGKVKLTGVKGQEQFMDATAVKLSVDQPIFIELQK